MEANEVAHWMLAQIDKDGCIYQDDVVDHLVKARREDLLRENADGNQVVGKEVLAAFRKLTADSTTLGHSAHDHLDTRSTRTWTPDPRPLGQAVGAQRRRFALLV